MVETLGQDGGYVGVGKGVVDGFAVAAEFYQGGLFEDAQLVGDGTLGHSQEVGDVADAEFSAGKGVEDTDAGRVAEDFVEIGKFIDELFCRRLDWEVYVMVVTDVTKFDVSFWGICSIVHGITCFLIFYMRIWGSNSDVVLSGLCFPDFYIL